MIKEPKLEQTHRNSGVLSHGYRCPFAGIYDPTKYWSRGHPSCSEVDVCIHLLASSDWCPQKAPSVQYMDTEAPKYGCHGL